MLRILLFGMALASGGGAAWLVASMGAEGPADAFATESREPRTEEVLVAAVDLEHGAQLGIDQLRWESWPVERTQSSFILRSDRPGAPEELAGSVLRSFLVAGTPLVLQSLAPTKSSLLSATLARGKRAVAISISAEKTAGGFILPNDRVDVLLSAQCRPADGCTSGISVRTILKNVRVLAIDQSGGKETSESSLIGKTATLELAPEQVETLIGAEASGTLSLVLRSAVDHDSSLESVEPKNGTVRVMRGGVTAYEKVR